MDFKDTKPIYMQIADSICNDIITGRYKENERIPSVREYASNLEVNANTVARSYDYLQQSEIIYNKRGIGYFVADSAAEKIRSIRKADFMKTQLPEFFHEIDMIGISIEEVVELWRKFKE